MTQDSMMFPSPAGAGNSVGTPNMSGPGSAAPERAADNAAPRGDLLDRVVTSAHATIDELADTAAPHVNRLTESLGKAGDEMHDEAGQLREAGAQFAESLRCVVRDNPLAALGTAVALGLLVARLTR